MLAYAADVIQPRRRAVTARRAAGRVTARMWAALAPHLLTVAAVCCGTTAAFTWRPWAGLLAAGIGLWLIELHIHLDDTPRRPSGGGR
jgi:hypothetical protein